MTRLILLLTAVLGTQSLFAQTSWSLQRCVDYAYENNLTIRQAELTARNADLTLKQSQMNRLPSVNGSGSAGYQFGRTIDPTTNQFNNTRIGFNNFSVNAGFTLYNGNSINNQIKQSKIDQQAAVLDAANTRQNIGLSIATSYLNILLSEEQVANAEVQRQLALQQLEQTNRLIEVGQLAANARLDLEAQVARNDQQIVEARNAVDLAYLTLRQLLQLEPGESLVIEKPELSVEKSILALSFDELTVYQTALNNQPSVQAARLRTESSLYDEKIAQAASLPSLSLFGSLSTQYSNAALDFTNPNLNDAQLVAQNPVPAEVAGQLVDVVFFDLEGITFPNLSYGDQLNENFGQALGVSLNVPIYNNHRNTIAKERARLGVIQAEMNEQQINNQLLTDVQTAVTSFRAAKDAYRAANRTQQSTEAALSDAQRRFDLGAINSFEYNNAVNNLDVARRDLTRAKYQLLFNQKVVEFYLGQALDL